MKYISIMFAILFGVTACNQTPQVEKAASAVTEAKPASSTVFN